MRKEVNVVIAIDRYKDRPAVRVDAGALCALFLPQDGGKLASLRDASGRELLAQASGDVYKRLSFTGRYTSSECSGFDDMFPTIDPYVGTSGEGTEVIYPDHGEICRLPMSLSLADGAATMHTFSRLFAYRYEKTASARDGGIHIAYHIENMSSEPFPCLWAAHCMFAGEEGATFVSPYADGAQTRLMFGTMGNFTMGPFDPERPSYKFYYADPLAEGWCGCYFPSQGRTLRLRFGGDALRFLGVWINHGSFRGMYNLALEPCTTPYDVPDADICSIAQAGQLNFSLSLEWSEE